MHTPSRPIGIIDEHPHWQPTHPGQWVRDLRELQFHTLSDLPTALHDCARPHQTRRTEAQIETSRLRDATYHTHQDPVVHMACQIRLREHQQQQRRRGEYHKTLDQARGRNWEFSHPAPTAAAQKLEGQKDRQDWGEVLGSFLADLYRCNEAEADNIHRLTWEIQNKARRTDDPRLKCHPNNLCDIVESLSSHRAAGKDGIPSQVIKCRRSI